MIDLSTCLKYYKREDIQTELVLNAENRELGVRYLNGNFGKRPDILQNKADVLEFAKQNVSSFHISEEHWENPLLLSNTMKKAELDKLRTGWDLVIDIDCPNWELSKKIAFVVIKILKKHGINSISCKFSGNKGFHIGVPFKSFPDFVQGKPTKLLFPEGVKRIMDYIVHYASKHYSDEILSGFDIKKLSSSLGMKEEEIYHEICLKCGKKYSEKKIKYDYICNKCSFRTQKDIFEDYITCPKCKSIIKTAKNDRIKKCDYCKSTAIKKEINLAIILGLDKILISPRHLYRMAYSLHEKTGLVSVPINPFSVLVFDKSLAKPENVKVEFRFMDDSKTKKGEASELILKAFDFNPETEEKSNDIKLNNSMKVKNFENNNEKVPLELFPPCIIKLLSGIKDGKKRSLFILINFLTSLGWDYPEIESLIYEWNKKNEEGLRETIIKGQINYHKIQKKKVLPPNCSNKMYYSDIGICIPDELCKTIKNPVNYSMKKAFFLNKNTKKKRNKTKNKEGET